MPKTKISEFDVDPANNTDINSINIAEGCAPSGINNAIRQLMSDLKEWQAGSQDIYITPAGSVSAPAITTTGDTNTGIYFPAADTIAFTEGGVESMRIDSSGNVGIGTSSPNRALTIYRTSSPVFQLIDATTGTTTNDGLLIQQVGVDTYIENAEIGFMQFRTSATERMRIDSSGNVGIGTSSPQNKLQVLGTIKVATGNAQGILGLGDGAGATINCGVWRGAANAPTTDGNYLNFGGYDGLVFATGNAAIGSQTERMRIDSSGNLLVGKTSASTSVVGLWLQGGAAAGAEGARINFTRGNNSDAQNHLAFYTAAGGNVGFIQTSTTNTTYSTSSDYRLKENVAPMTGALDKVQALKPCTYTWKVDGSNGEGFIAHELAEVVPDCVTGEKDAVDAEGNPQYQGIDTSFLVATLTAAIQELNAKVTALEAQLNK